MNDQKINALSELYSLMAYKPSKEDKDLIEKAYLFAKKVHKGQKRFSGEPYFNHCFITGKNLATFGLDPQTIAAGILHDTLEDTEVTEREIEEAFGVKILFLIQGVTKLGKLRYQGLDRHTESLRKLFVATSQDIRVLLIKFADRLHNISTLEYVNEAKRQRIAKETLQIYAPLAGRLGMGRLRGELEEYSFPYALPEDYAEVKKLLRKKSKENEKHLKKVYRTLKMKLLEGGFEDAKVTYRSKGVFSLYKKLKKNGKNINKIYDLSAIRVTAKSEEECYRILGLVHSTWKPMPGRIKDYIAFPKPNGYRSIHTTVLIGDGGFLEIQIRTSIMHREAEYGIAAHWEYKEGSKKNKNYYFDKNLRKVKEIINDQKSIKDSSIFLEELKTDLFEECVFVFTPKHDVIDLAKGSTVIDFAYAIHSDIGDKMSGANINGKFVAITTELTNGDIVEIITKKSVSPSNKWLKHAKTSVAKKHIRTALQGQNWFQKKFL